MAGPAPHILIVEDDPAQCEVLRYNVQAQGYRVTLADNGEEGLLCAREDTPDVIVLDWMMPHLSGIEVCRRLRAKPETAEIPIIMLSAKSEDFDKVRALDMGADDYMVKPYSVSELMARIRNQIRRNRPSAAGHMLQFDDIVVDTETHRATQGGHDLKLGPTEFRLLCTFIEKPGRVWTRDALLDRVWGRDTYLDTRTVDVHVGRLRKVLTAVGQPDPIRTVRGAGYAFG